MRASNPNIKILVAQLLPMNLQLPGVRHAVVALDAQIPGWAISKSTSQSPLIVVDQWTAFDTATDTNGVHPNGAGDQKVSDRWIAGPSALLTPRRRRRRRR